MFPLADRIAVALAGNGRVLAIRQRAVVCGCEILLADQDAVPDARAALRAAGLEVETASPFSSFSLPVLEASLPAD